MKILVINGPNLNLLGKRESSIYGNESSDDIISSLENICAKKNASLLTFQSNAEHEIVEKIHSCQNKKVDWMIINPGAFTHTSIAIRDALIISHIFLTLLKVLYVDLVPLVMRVPY